MDDLDAYVGLIQDVHVANVADAVVDDAEVSSSQVGAAS